MTEKTVLVTGGGGYLGSHTITELLNNSYSVIALDNFSNLHAEANFEKPESLRRVEKITGRSVTFYKIDVSNKDDLVTIFKSHQIEYVIHLAALKYMGESTKAPLKYYMNNIATSLALLEVMQEFKIKNLIFSSSSNVYGDPEFLPITENHPTGQNCKNPYAKSKYFIEEILKDVCRSDPEWNIISLRYFTPSGAHKSGLIGENPLSTNLSLIPCIAQVATGHKDKVSIFGYNYNTKDGTCVKDYTHVTDIAVGHIRALEKLTDSSFNGWKVYNLGSGNGYTILDIVTIFEGITKKKIKYEFFERKKETIEAIYADPSKAKIELNWEATESITNICRDVWNWHLSNQTEQQNFNIHY